MSFNPVLPGYIIIGIAVAMVALVIYALVKLPRTKKSYIALTVRVIAVTLLAVAALRPMIPAETEIQRLGTNLDFYFALDTTASMGAVDVGEESRLNAAKREIMRVANEHVGSKFGVFTFDSKGRVSMPLVRDISALKSSLETIKPQPYREGSVTPTGGGSIEEVGPTLEKALAANKEAYPERLRILYYITDGEDTTKENGVKEPTTIPETVKGLLDEAYVVGTGNETPVEIPMYVFNEDFSGVREEGVYRTIDGQVGLSAMNSSNIKQLAEKLGATPTFLSKASDTLPEVKSVSKQEKISIPDQTAPAQFEFYWLLTITAFLLLTLDMLILYTNTFNIWKRRR